MCIYSAIGYFYRIVFFCYFWSTKLVENGFNIQYLFMVQTYQNCTFRNYRIYFHIWIQWMYCYRIGKFNFYKSHWSSDILIHFLDCCTFLYWTNHHLLIYWRRWTPDVNITWISHDKFFKMFFFLLSKLNCIFSNRAVYQTHTAARTFSASQKQDVEARMWFSTTSRFFRQMDFVHKHDIQEDAVYDQRAPPLTCLEASL